MQYALAILFTLFLWWFSTGAVLYLIGLPRQSHAWSMIAATVVLGFALTGLVVSSEVASTAGAYCAFTCGLLVWAWHELSFLTGFITGPSKEPCPADRKGWERFTGATMTLIYHELAILMTAVLLVALTFGAPNQFGTWTFLLLWVMRLSAKLNVFLGVPTLTEQFLPQNLGYLKTYFRKRPMNLLFPFAVTAATVFTWILIERAAASTTGFAAAGYTMLATLSALAVLEHWFLVLPLPVARLWAWGLRSRETVAQSRLERRFNWFATQQGGSARPHSAWTKSVGGDDHPLVTLSGR